MSTPQEKGVSPSALLGQLPDNVNVKPVDDLFGGGIPTTNPSVGTPAANTPPAAQPPQSPQVSQQPINPTPTPNPSVGQSQATEKPADQNPPQTLAGEGQGSVQQQVPETPPADPAPPANKPFWDGFAKDQDEVLERVKAFSGMQEQLGGMTQQLNTLQQEYDVLKQSNTFVNPAVEKLNNYMRSLGTVENPEAQIAQYMKLRYTDYSQLNDLDIIRENLRQQGVAPDQVETYMAGYTIQQEPSKPDIDPESEYAGIYNQQYQAALSQVRMHNQTVTSRLHTDALNARNAIAGRQADISSKEGSPAVSEGYKQAQATHKQFMEALPTLVEKYEHVVDLGGGKSFKFELGPNERAAMLKDFQAAKVGSGITAQNVVGVFSNYVSKAYLPNILRTYGAQVATELKQQQVSEMHNPTPVGQGGSVAGATNTNEQKETEKVNAFMSSL